MKKGDIIYHKCNNKIKLVIREIDSSGTIVCRYFNDKTSRIEDIDISEAEVYIEVPFPTTKTYKK